MAQSRRTYFERGIASERAKGEMEGGDHFLFLPRDGGFLAVVADGLGHGPEAAAAAKQALATVLEHGHESPSALMRLCHLALKGTRGAAVGIAEFASRTQVLRAVIVGSVQMAVVNGWPGRGRRQFVLQRPGIVGEHVPWLMDEELPMDTADRLIIATDGVGNQFADNLDYRLGAQLMAERIVRENRLGNDDALALVVKAGSSP